MPAARGARDLRRPGRQRAARAARRVIDSTDRDGELLLDPTNVEQAHIADIDTHAGSSRVPVLLCGPLLHRLGEAFIPDLGGCRIGERPINYHLDVLREFGAEVEKRQDGLRLTAPRGLHAADVHLPYPSVGATEQVLLTAVRARGLTALRNAAIEPEIMDLIAILQKMGAIITVQTDRVITIEGVDRLGGFDHLAIPDRIEAGSWACAALATNGDIYVRGAQQLPMMPFLNVFRRIGGAFDVDDEGIRFWHPGGTLRAIALETDVHPGLHDRLAAAARRRPDPDHRPVDRPRDGLREPARLHRRAARDGRADPDLPRVPGRVTVPLRPRQLPALGGHLRPDAAAGAEITVPDLRGGFSYLIAALAAEGRSKVHGIELIYRGYERFSEKLDALGAAYKLG